MTGSDETPSVRGARAETKTTCFLAKTSHPGPENWDLFKNAPDALRH
jgi:hypothetical protein